jgi:DNA (cytosine-5)-methyltransferase 1
MQMGQPWALYNEIDPYAADWLENLIAAGHIAPGIVDRRSIVDVEADGLREFTQIHWFAGIGGWSLALRRAGYPDDRRIWTASLPCQPFSAAGQQKAMNDDRHLWPVFYDLVRKCRPPICVGEQVSSKPALAWWDVVSHDFQTSGYAVAAADTSVAQYGGPHIRQRLYWTAQRVDDAADARHASARGGQSEQPERGRSVSGVGRSGGGLAHANCK